MATYYLFETATGYSLFEGKTIEEIGGLLESVQSSITSYKRFKKVVQLVAFLPFTSSDQALENMREISAGKCSKDLRAFLKGKMPSLTKSKYKLAVEDSRLPTSLNEVFPDLTLVKNEITSEVFRGIRHHFSQLVEGFDIKHLSRGQLGLAHAYSRSKVMTDIKRYDKHIIHAISLIDQLDKDINTFSMRLKEWYSWHFPELWAIVNDNLLFAKAVKVIRNKADLDAPTLEKLAKILENEEISQEIASAAKISMGGDLSELDSLQIALFTDKVISLSLYRIELAEYLRSKMDEVAPNLAALIGEIVGARLISQAGGLSNLAKYPASTVQILGAEKALFRALKTRGNTPKYGILYHSSFIGRAGPTDKGRISRFLANKCSLASRIDMFYPTPTSAFGKRMNQQVEERLKYFVNGERGPSNEDVMHEVIELLQLENGKQVKRSKKSESNNDPNQSDDSSLPKKKQKVKKPTKDSSEESEVPVKKSKKKPVVSSESEEPKIKKKKAKKVESSGSEVEVKKQKKNKKISESEEEVVRKKDRKKNKDGSSADEVKKKKSKGKNSR